ncbi:hypothetical protein J2S30_000061 [Herbaspirillum rubrisubalbicans]|uniref:hypothetical protein n=1 Tax=Herbaspirillum rubrisubalbicans TaxID=80842 RepID=UPI0020A0EBAA|nr:hypothetical protein [Herbaspirillum rubrisubalbicans]MCP1571682.1 hypothetical protein [Herbaspirillum rubrisubalbicans]
MATAGRDINSASTTVATANAVTSGTSADNITLVAQRDVSFSTVHETSQEKLAWDNDNTSSGNAQIFTVENSATGIKEVQFSPSSEKSQHAGQYYKLTYTDGSKI